MKDPGSPDSTAPEDEGGPRVLKTPINQTAGPRKNSDSKGSTPPSQVTKLSPNMAVDLLLARQGEVDTAKQPGTERLKKAVLEQHMRQNEIENGSLSKKAALAGAGAEQERRPLSSQPPIAQTPYGGAIGTSRTSTLLGGRSAVTQSSNAASVSASLPSPGGDKGNGQRGTKFSEVREASMDKQAFVNRLIRSFTGQTARRAGMRAADDAAEVARKSVQSFQTQAVNAEKAMKNLQADLSRLQGLKKDSLVPTLLQDGHKDQMKLLHRQISDQKQLMNSSHTNVTHATASVEAQTAEAARLREALEATSDLRWQTAGGLGAVAGGKELYDRYGKEGSAGPGPFERVMRTKLARGYYDQVRPQEVLGEVTVPDGALAAAGFGGGALAGQGAAGLGAGRSARNRIAPLLEMLQKAPGNEDVMRVARQEAQEMGLKLPRALGNNAHIAAEGGRLERALMKAIRRKRLLPLMGLGGLAGLTVAGHYRRAAGQDRDPFNGPYPMPYGG